MSDQGESEKPKPVTIRFQMWLTTLATALNVFSTGAAIVGIIFAAQQVRAALDSVDRSSRNEAYSRFLDKHQELCRQSITIWDQMDGITLSLPEDIKFPDGWDALLLAADYEDVEAALNTERRDQYAKETVRIRQELENAHRLLAIWITDEQADQFFGLIPHPDDFSYRTSTSGPPTVYDAFQAIDNQYRCRRNVEGSLAYFKGMSDEKLEAEGDPGLFVLPISTKRSVEDILIEWNENILVDRFNGTGLFEYLNKATSK